MPRLHGPWVLTIGVSLGLGGLPSARANDLPLSGVVNSSSDPGEEARRVEVVVTASPEEARRLAQLLEELLGRLKLTVVVHLENSAGSASSVGDHGLAHGHGLAHVVVELTDAGRALCTIRNAEGRLRMERREVSGATSRAILLDEVAHLIHAAVESLLAEGTAPAVAAPATAEPPRSASNRAPAAPTAPTATPPQPARPVRTAADATEDNTPHPAFGFDVGSLVGLRGVADDMPLVFGVAATAHASYRNGSVHPGGWLSADYRLPFAVDRFTTAQITALRALPSLDFYSTRPWSVGIALGLGIDIYRIEHSLDSAAEKAADLSRSETIAVLAVFGVARYRLMEGLHLVSFAGLELDTEHANVAFYRNQNDPSELGLVHPTFLLGLGYTPLGAEPTK